MLNDKQTILPPILFLDRPLDCKVEAEMKIHSSCHFYRQDFSMIPFLWKIWPPSKDKIAAFLGISWALGVSWLGITIEIWGENGAITFD